LLVAVDLLRDSIFGVGVYCSCLELKNVMTV
jgi:hypothetical protein